MPTLVVKEGVQLGQSFVITGDQVRIGRGTQCDIQLLDPSVSRAHATLYRGADGAYYLRDENSSYGSFINGERVREGRLNHGAACKLGLAVLEFQLETPSDGRTPLEDTDSLPESYTIVQSLRGDTPSGVGPPPSDAQELRLVNDRLRAVYDISETISATFDLDALYKKLLQAIFANLKADRAAILLVDPPTGKIAIKASLDSRGREQDVPYSSTIVRAVVERGESLLLSNAQQENFLGAAQSVFLHDIRSAMCVPLRTRDRIIGALTVDAGGVSVFARHDLQLLTLIGNQAGVMIQNARLVEENIKAERLAAVGQTVASLAHCIKNILQGLKGGAFMVDEGMKGQDMEMILAAWPLLKGSQQRITELVMNMLDYSKERKPAYELADLREHMANIHGLMSERAKEKEVAVILEFDDGTPRVECDPMALYRATLNLVTNAIDAAPDENGRVVLRVRPADTAGHVLISVGDNGAGIPPEVRQRLFEAFHSTKESKGTGLGLAVTKKIVDEHRGEVLIETEVGRGTTFTLKLPVRKPA